MMPFNLNLQFIQCLIKREIQVIRLFPGKKMIAVSKEMQLCLATLFFLVKNNLGIYWPMKIAGKF
jgi:hypothetical protein